MSVDQLQIDTAKPAKVSLAPDTIDKGKTTESKPEASSTTETRHFFNPDAKPGEVEVSPKALQDSLQALYDRFITVQRLANDPKGILSSTDRLVVELFKDTRRTEQIAKLLANQSPSTVPLKPDSQELNGLSFSNQEKAAIVLILEQTSRDYAYTMGRRSNGVEQTITKGVNWRKIPPENINMVQINYRWVPVDLAGKQVRISHVEQSSFHPLRPQEKDARLQGMGATIAKLTEELTGHPIADVIALGNISVVETANIQRGLMEVHRDEHIRGLAQQDRPLEALWNYDPALAIQIEHDSYDVAARREASEITQRVLAEKYDASQPFRALVLKQAEARLETMAAKKIEFVMVPAAPPFAVGVEDQGADQERLKNLSAELKRNRETLQQSSDRINEITARLSDLQGATGLIVAQNTELTNYVDQYNVDKGAIAGTAAQQQAALTELSTRAETIKKLREELHKLQVEEKTLVQERTAKERQNATVLQDRIDYLNQLNIQEITTASPQDQIDAGRQIMDVAKKHISGTQDEGLNAVLKGILSGSSGAEARRMALHSMDNLRLVLEMDAKVLSDRQLRNIIASKIGFTYQDIDDADPGAAEANRNLLSALAARNPYEFALVLDAAIDNRLQALARGTPTEFLAAETRERTLEFVKALETADNSLHRQGFIEGVNCVRWRKGLDIGEEHYEIICNGGEPTVYKLVTQSDRSRKLVSLGGIGISQVGANYIQEQASAEVMAIRQQVLQEIWLSALGERPPGQYNVVDNGGQNRTLIVEPGGKIYIKANNHEFTQRLLTYAIDGSKTVGWVLDKLGIRKKMDEWRIRDKTLGELPGYESSVKQLRPWEISKARELFFRAVEDIPLESYMVVYPNIFTQHINQSSQPILVNNVFGLLNRGIEIHNEIEASHNGGVNREGVASYRMLADGALEITWNEPGRPYRRCRQTFYPNGMTQGEYGIRVNGGHIRILRQKINNFLTAPNISINNPTARRQALTGNYRLRLHTAVADGFIQMTNVERRQFDFRSIILSLPGVGGAITNYELNMNPQGDLLIRDNSNPNNQPMNLNDFLNTKAIENAIIPLPLPAQTFLQRYQTNIRNMIGTEFLQSLARPRRT